MSDVVSNDDLNALAAEYVLGTLDYEERKGASALLEVDSAFQGIVRVWERRFGDLHLMVEAVEPDPQLWARIKPKTAGIEQVPPAIPSSADEAAVVAVAPAPKADAPSAPPPGAAASVAPAAGAAAATPEPAREASAVGPNTDVSKPDAPEPDASKTDASKTDASKTDASKTDAPEPDAPAAEGTPPATDAKPSVETKPAAEPVPPAIAETELKLAELAALLPVASEQSAAAPTTQAEPVDDGLHTHAPELVPRGFVPPAPMSTRGSPLVVEVPVRSSGRGWVAGTLAMGLVAIALAGLISAWRFFPERLPAQLRANTLLNLTPQPPPQPQAKARPTLAPFDE